MRIHCDAKCDAISADSIELLARAVVLVAGMKLTEAERATVFARVLVAAGKESRRPRRALAKPRR
jgi:hypothetical protein